MTAFAQQLNKRTTAAGIAVSDNHFHQLERYFELLRRWNRRMNLTSLPLDGFPDATLDRLIIEPLVAAQQVPDSPALWFDLGSGGGSPALPMKIVRPELILTMVEAKARKAAFLREAVRVLGLGDTDVEHIRVEELASQEDNQGLANLITVRAVRMDPTFTGAVDSLLAPAGRVLLFTGSTEPAGLADPAGDLLQVVSEHPLNRSGRLRVLRKRST